MKFIYVYIYILYIPYTYRAHIIPHICTTYRNHIQCIQITHLSHRFITHIQHAKITQNTTYIHYSHLSQIYIHTYFKYKYISITNVYIHIHTTHVTHILHIPCINMLYMYHTYKPQYIPYIYTIHPYPVHKNNDSLHPVCLPAACSMFECRLIYFILLSRYISL